MEGWPCLVKIGKGRVRVDIRGVGSGRYVLPVPRHTTVVFGNEEHHFASEGWFTVTIETPTVTILWA
jgi:hypothetical protein